MMTQRNRRREGAQGLSRRLVGRSQRPRYREIEAGDRIPSPSTCERISELYGWPKTFVGATVRSGGEADLLVVVVHETDASR